MKGSIVETERVLRICARRAHAADVPLVYDAFEDDAGGVCVLGAYNRFSGGMHLSLPDGDDSFSAAWDAIEAGFDRAPRKGHPIRWWNLGRRLRRALKPVAPSR